MTNVKNVIKYKPQGKLFRNKDFDGKVFAVWCSACGQISGWKSQYDHAFDIMQSHKLQFNEMKNCRSHKVSMRFLTVRGNGKIDK